jgi:hypothetical protein
MSLPASSAAAAQYGFFGAGLDAADPEVFDAIGKELNRQQNEIELRRRARC